MSADAENIPMGSRGEEEPLPAHDQADIDAMNAEPQGTPIDSLSFHNYPRAGESVALRPIVFGPASEKAVLLIEVDPATGAIDVVLGNGPVNSEAPDGAIELMSIVIDLLQDAEFRASWAALLEQQKAETDETGVEVGPDDVRDGRDF